MHPLITSTNHNSKRGLFGIKYPHSITPVAVLSYTGLMIYRSLRLWPNLMIYRPIRLSYDSIILLIREFDSRIRNLATLTSHFMARNGIRASLKVVTGMLPTSS